MDEPEIRQAAAHDLETVNQMLHQAGLPLDGVADAREGFCVAVLHERVVAAAAVERYGSAGLLRSVVVAPEHRGRALGQALVADRLRWAHRQGLGELYLLTTDAAPFFERLGFRVVARHQVPGPVQASSEFAHLCPATATAMVRTTAAAGCCGGRV